jgi:hypothetical protein
MRKDGILVSTIELDKWSLIFMNSSVLFKKAKKIPLYAKLLGQGIDMREQRQETSDFHKELFSILGSYSAR